MLMYTQILTYLGICGGSRGPSQGDPVPPTSPAAAPWRGVYPLATPAQVQQNKFWGKGRVICTEPWDQARGRKRIK